MITIVAHPLMIDLGQASAMLYEESWYFRQTYGRKNASPKTTGKRSSRILKSMEMGAKGGVPGVMIDILIKLRSQTCQSVIASQI